MDQKVSEILGRLTESATLAMSRKSRELKARGVDVISLSLGEPDFQTPDFIKEAAKKAIDENYTTYMPVNGYEDLRQSISAKFKRDNGLDYSPNQIVVSTGAKQSIMNAILSIVNPGDEVILPIPYWVSYTEMVKVAGGEIVEVPSGIESDYKITPSQLEKAITPKSRMIIFSSPCNPSGSVYSEQELRALADVIAQHPRLIIVSDEIYEHIIFGQKNFSIASVEKVYDQTITINGVSKAFAMTGWRIGYLGAPEWIAKACTKLQGQFTSGASSIAQRAAKAAVEADPAVVSEMVAAFERRRGLIISLLEEIPGLEVNHPEGAFYVFPDVSSYFGKSYNGQTIQNSDDLAEFLLETGHVALVGGAAFGQDNCIRISYAASDEMITQAVSRIKTALAKLN